jgi:Ca2+-transporting ATPase
MSDLPQNPGRRNPDARCEADSGWYLQSVDAVLSAQKSSAQGLAPTEVERRLGLHGENRLQQAPRISSWRIFLAQFKSLIIWILIVAGAISAVLGDAIDAIAILAIVLLNAVIGFYQEYSAEQSIAALRKMTAPQAKVRRAGKVVAVAAVGVVPGDILVLEAGDLVAADARLIKAASLKCVESALTGESEAVSKQCEALAGTAVPLGNRDNMVFMGTTVAAGTAVAVVVATAMKTELGRIAGLIDSAASEEATPLEKRLESFGRILVWAALGIVAMLFVLGMLRGTPWYDLMMTSVSLAVAAIPEGLPAVVTVALSVGVLRMARRRALIRKLAAVETLGSTTVICTDKTGTLTVGEMTVRAFYVDAQSFTLTGEGYAPQGEVQFESRPVAEGQEAALVELATVLVACNSAHLLEEDGAWKTVGDPTEGAFLVAGAKVGVDRARIEQELPRQHENPFDSDRKLSSTVRRTPSGGLRVFLNGAPGELLQRCTHYYSASGLRPLTDADRRRILKQTSSLARLALRVLASATRDLSADASADLSAEAVERDLVFVGLCGMHDPPRAEARQALGRCREAGIRVVMITGDHAETAIAIARELGIATDSDAAVSGTELDAMTDADLQSRVSGIPVYARVSAAHKLRIIRAWKANDAVVAMTGDGVNDAPAIKGADIGIAMGQAGTEVTKQAAKMIITDDNFATIVAAVEEGRGIYDNIRKTLQYLLAGNTGELLLMMACVLIGLPMPLLPIHLLWINLVTDGLPALCLATDPIDPDVMKRQPRHRSERITDRHFLVTMMFTGTLTAAVAFAVYVFALENGSVEMARTQAFAVLVFAELLRSFGARSETKPVWRISVFSNLNLLLVVLATFALQVWSQHSTLLSGFLKTALLPITDCLILLGLGSIPLLILELAKVVRNRRRTPSTAAVAP